MKKLNTVLLIDDNKATSYFNKVIIEELNVCNTVQIVCDGEEAIHYITNTGKFIENKGEYPTPELILLDIKMHGMNGFDFLDDYKKLTLAQKGSSTIVMLTSSQLESEKELTQSYKDVKDYIQKPLTKTDIEILIKTHFKMINSDHLSTT